MSRLKEKEDEVTKTVQKAKSILESVKSQVDNLIYERNILIKKREMKRSSKLWLMKQRSSTSGQDLNQINQMIEDVEVTVSELSRQIDELEVKIKAQNRHAEQTSAQLVLVEEKKKQLEIKVVKIQKEKLDLESELERDRKYFEGEMQRIMHDHELQLSEVWYKTKLYFYYMCMQNITCTLFLQTKAKLLKEELDHKRRLEIVQAKIPQPLSQVCMSCGDYCIYVIGLSVIVYIF